MSTVVKEIIDKNIVKGEIVSDPLQRLVGNYFSKETEPPGQSAVAVDLQAGSYQHWDASWTTAIEISDGLFSGKQQRITMKYVGLGTLKDASPQVLKQYFQDNLNFNTTFSNHNLAIPIPAADTDPETFSNSSIDIESFYNYEFYNYEILSNSSDCKDLPSYLLFDYADKAKDYNPAKMDFIRSYDGQISNSSVESVLGPGSTLEEQKVCYNVPDNNDSNLYLFNRKSQNGGYGQELKGVSSNYFNMFTKTLSQASTEFDLSSYRIKSSNIFIHYDYGIDNLDYLPHWVKVRIPKLRSLPEIDPMAGNAEFSGLGFDTTKIDEALKKNRLSKFLFSFIKNSTPSYKAFYCGQAGQMMLKELKTWDLAEWWKSDPFEKIEEAEDEIFLLNEEDVNLAKSNSVLERRLRKVVALGMIRETTGNNLHDFEN